MTPSRSLLHDPAGCECHLVLKAGVELQVSLAIYRTAVKKGDFDVRLFKHRAPSSRPAACCRPIRYIEVAHSAFHGTSRQMAEPAAALSIQRRSCVRSLTHLPRAPEQPRGVSGAQLLVGV